MKNGQLYKSRQKHLETNLSSAEMRKKITEGLKLSFKKLVQVKKLTNGSLVFSENGKIVEIKAKDIKI